MHIITSCSICGGSASKPLVIGDLQLAVCYDCCILVLDAVLKVKYPDPPSDPPSDPEPDLPLLFNEKEDTYLYGKVLSIPTNGSL